LRHKSQTTGVVIDGSETACHLTLCTFSRAAKYNQEFRWQ
jgi:hypothetical protein